MVFFFWDYHTKDYGANYVLAETFYETAVHQYLSLKKNAEGHKINNYYRRNIWLDLRQWKNHDFEP